MGRNRPVIGAQFAPRRIDMMESAAFRALSLSARRVLDRLEIELAHHGGKDNGRLPVTFDDFVAYGLHRHAIGPAIREAVALGFVEINHGRARGVALGDLAALATVEGRGPAEPLALLARLGNAGLGAGED
jgi:hypothetical protein